MRNDTLRHVMGTEKHEIFNFETIFESTSLFESQITKKNGEIVFNERQLLQFLKQYISNSYEFIFRLLDF